MEMSTQQTQRWTKNLGGLLLKRKKHAENTSRKTPTCHKFRRVGASTNSQSKPTSVGGLLQAN